MISSAIANIASESTMIKSGIKGEAVRFSSTDFANAVGNTASHVKILSVPDTVSGVLKLGNTMIHSGQTISMENLNLLTFYPANDVTECSFTFSTDGSYETKCFLKLTDKQNSSPVLLEAGLFASTQADISYYGSLNGYDPDGDELKFEITAYPKHGLVEITDETVGTFIYTPYAGITGNDSFEYRVRDSFGNYSVSSTVSLNITERAGDTLLSDMNGHWAHNAALVMVESGSMDVIEEMGKVYFDPEELISREDFLKTVMISLGAPNLSSKDTVFADNSEISDLCKGYVATAYRLGIIKGTREGDKLCFNPKDTITRAEAAVILNRILGAKASGTLTVFADSDHIPAWAEADIMALSSLGIMKGNGTSAMPLDMVSRAQTAQMLYITKSIYE